MHQTSVLEQKMKFTVSDSESQTLDPKNQDSSLESSENVDELKDPSSVITSSFIADAQPEVRKIIEQLVRLWRQTANPNAFLFACYVLKHPAFVTDDVPRMGKTKLNHNLKRSLLDRLVGKLMNNNKHSTGKKVKVKNLVCKILEPLKKPELTLSATLLLYLVRSVPNYDIRRQKYGSGLLTRAVRLTVYRKIVWYLSSLSNYVKSRKPRGNLVDLLTTEFKELETSSSRSVLLTKKKECEQNAAKSNIQ